MLSFNACSCSSSSSLSYGYNLMLWKASSALIYKIHVHSGYRKCQRKRKLLKHTRCLKASRSSIVNESDLAMTGTTLTTSESFLSTTTSMGFSLSGTLVNVQIIRSISICNIRVTRGCNEEETAVNSRVGDVAITLGSQFLAEISRVLIFDVLDNRLPAGPNLQNEFVFPCVQ